MGPRHSKADILDGALAAALDEGLSQLTFGRLAKRLGISDRTIVYYFPSKDELLRDVVLAMGSQLQDALATAFTTPAPGHRELMAAAWPVVATPEHDRIFALFFEVNGLAAVGREPYRELVATLVRLWIDWAASFIEGTPEHRQVEAETAIALLDGLLLLRQLAGPEAADRAARACGIR